MKKKRVLIFGAGGFIGTYLIDALLKSNYEVLASDISPFGEKYYDDNKIPFISVDIAKRDDFEKIEKIKFDAVVHLAALQPANVSFKKFDPRDYINVNVQGTLNILDFCMKNHTDKLVYASSHRNTQGLWAKNKAIREEEGKALKFNGEYAMFSISESTAQDCIEYYRQQHGLKSIIFRLPPVYGYGPHAEIFKNGKPEMTGFLTFIEKSIACEPLEMWGDSRIGRDIVYVKDVVHAFIKALDNVKAQGLFNITSGKYLTLKEQVETTAKVFWGDNSNPKIMELKEKPNNMDSFLYDNSKAKDVLGWSPQYSFEEMLIDIKEEMKNKKFEFLIKKRKQMLKEE
jgi:UDP-glucose 4-epimerase